MAYMSCCININIDIDIDIDIDITFVCKQKHLIVGDHTGRAHL